MVNNADFLYSRVRKEISGYELATIVIVMLLIASIIVVHLEVLRIMSARVLHLRRVPRMRIIVMLIAALCSHLVHVSTFAIALQFLEKWAAIGTIEGAAGRDFADAIYFSITSYAALGTEDLFSTGEMRLLSCPEALNGLGMVGWSASMTYLHMEKFWHLQSKHR